MLALALAPQDPGQAHSEGWVTFSPGGGTCPVARTPYPWENQALADLAPCTLPLNCKPPVPKNEV